MTQHWVAQLTETGEGAGSPTSEVSGDPNDLAEFVNRGKRYVESLRSVETHVSDKRRMVTTIPSLYRGSPADLSGDGAHQIGPTTDGASPFDQLVAAAERTNRFVTHVGETLNNTAVGDAAPSSNVSRERPRHNGTLDQTSRLDLSNWTSGLANLVSEILGITGSVLPPGFFVCLSGSAASVVAVSGATCSGNVGGTPVTFQVVGGGIGMELGGGPVLGYTSAKTPDELTGSSVELGISGPAFQAAYSDSTDAPWSASAGPAIGPVYGGRLVGTVTHVQQPSTTSWDTIRDTLFPKKVGTVQMDPRSWWPL